MEATKRGPLSRSLEKEVVHVLQKQARVDERSDQHSE